MKRINQLALGLVAVSLFGASLLTRADDRFAFQSYLEKNISAADEAVCKVDASPDKADENEWKLRQFSMKVSPYVSYGLSETMELTISPEVELIWEKGPNPDQD